MQRARSVPWVGDRAGRRQVLDVVRTDEEEVDRHRDRVEGVHHEVEVARGSGVVLEGEPLHRRDAGLVELVVEGAVHEPAVRHGGGGEREEVEVGVRDGEGVPARLDLHDPAGWHTELDEGVEGGADVGVDGVDVEAGLVDDVSTLGGRALGDPHVGIACVARGDHPEGAVATALVDRTVDGARAVASALGERPDGGAGHLDVVGGQVAERDRPWVQVEGVVDADEVERGAGGHVVDDLRHRGAVVGVLARGAASERGGHGSRELRAELCPPSRQTRDRRWRHRCPSRRCPR